MAEIIRHGIVYAGKGLRDYYGWPSVTAMSDGRIIAVASGQRMAHVCPWGRTVAWESKDDGRTWGPEVIIGDSAIDDRDAGVVALPNGQLMVSWFTSDTRNYASSLQHLPEPRNDLSMTVIRGWDDAIVARNLGSFVRKGTWGEEWSEPIDVGVTAPHGPIVLEDGALLYLGKAYSDADADILVHGVGYPRPNRLCPQSMNAPILCVRSDDMGDTWHTIGRVDKTGIYENNSLHEPHVVQLPGGRLVGMIRTQRSSRRTDRHGFGMAVTYSDDGGITWSEIESMPYFGSPPHLLLHSSGVLICSYGYRHFADPNCGPDAHGGERAILSYDGGQTWSDPMILRDDGPDDDLGYPCSCELPGGEILTVYYQKQKSAQESCSILYTIWKL